VRPLTRGFFARPAELVARELLGARIVAGADPRSVTGLITETEAYLGRDDPASHAFRGRLHAGNASIYLPAGTWYVYRSYGIHWCANLVVGPPGAGAAVLLRGVLPLEGIGLMRRRRGPGVPDRRLADGPGKLTQALGITRALDGVPMWRSGIRVGPGGETLPGPVRVTPRIGITRAADWPLRFLLELPPGG
jgi:DNA-3-methyladenine glycosylase